MPIKLILRKKVNASEIDLEGKNDYHFWTKLGKSDYSVLLEMHFWL